MTQGRPWGYLVLLVIGAAWGLSAPMIKLATEATFRPATIMLWQALVAVVVLGVVLGLTGRLQRLPLDARHLRLYVVVGLFGMALPSLASYSATTHLPAGVVSVIISLAPVFALPLALTLGTERFDARRMVGVGLGALAMVLLMAPQTSLPAPGLWVWVPVAALAPLFYAIEGAYVFGAGAVRATPLQVLWAGYAVSLMVAIPLALADGARVLPPAGAGLAMAGFLLAGLLGIGAYGGYLWLIRRAGAVFGALSTYAVTGMGVIWAMLLLGERYSVWVWAALALLVAGLSLVQPRSGAWRKEAEHGRI